MRDARKKVVKYERVFTKNQKNTIIKKNYNPLEVNKITEEGLFMKGEILKVVEKLSEKYNKKESLLLKMIEKCDIFGYNIKETEKLIEEFIKKSDCY